MLGEENISKDFISGRAYTGLMNLIAECGKGTQQLASGFCDTRKFLRRKAWRKFRNRSEAC